MSRKNNSSQSEKVKDRTNIYLAIIGLIGTLLVALIGVINNRTAILLPFSLELTRTAIAPIKPTETNSSFPSNTEKPLPNNPISTQSNVNVNFTATNENSFSILVIITNNDTSVEIISTIIPPHTKQTYSLPEGNYNYEVTELSDDDSDLNLCYPNEHFKLDNKATFNILILNNKCVTSTP